VSCGCETSRLIKLGIYHGKVYVIVHWFYWFYLPIGIRKKCIILIVRWYNCEGKRTTCRNLLLGDLQNRHENLNLEFIVYDLRLLRGIRYTHCASRSYGLRYKELLRACETQHFNLIILDVRALLTPRHTLQRDGVWVNRSWSSFFSNGTFFWVVPYVESRNLGQLLYLWQSRSCHLIRKIDTNRFRVDLFGVCLWFVCPKSVFFAVKLDVL
jgi:hypothetical protein